MDLQRLRYFVEVARQKHFTRAAEVCHVSQPSLSQQIKKLEEELGGAVFERSRERVVLTPLGKDFLKHARAILAEVHSAEEFVHRVQEDQQRTIRIGVIPTIAPYLAPEILRAIGKRVPAARFELLESHTATLTEALMTGKIDYALLSPPTEVDPECDHLTLFEDELLLTLPKEHVLAQALGLNKEALGREVILQLEASHCLAGQVGSYCRDFGLAAALDLRANQIDTLVALVEKGYGVCFTPSMAVRALRHRKLVFRSMEPQPWTREIRLLWIKQQFLSRTQQAVIESVRQACRQP